MTVVGKPEDILNTQNHISNYLKLRQKYSATRRVLN